MAAGAILSVMLAMAVNSAIPRPCIIMVATRTAERGKRAGLTVSLGMATAQIIYVVTAYCLVTLALPVTTGFQSLIRILGAGVVAFLAVRMMTESRQAPRADAGRVAPVGGDYGMGLVMGLTNPFTLVFLLSVLPQFPPEALTVSQTSLALIAGIFCASLAPKVATVLLTHHARHFGQGFGPFLVRLGALSMMLCAGMSVASMHG